MIRKLLREPLLHFALIGAALFVVYGWMNPVGRTSDRIVVTQAIVDDLARQHAARWMRPATDQELANLVEAYVRDEILFREGVSFGLDRDDPVIKRRVRQKLEVISEEQGTGSPPTDAELLAFMVRNPARFTRPATVSFEQITFDGSQSVPDVERVVAAARATLARGADPTKLGQPTLLPRSVQALPIDLVARDFGSRFAEELIKLPQGEWSGPVASSMGAHLVRVTARTLAELPPLDEVRQPVLREWENERRERARAESYRRLRDSYTVVVESRLPKVAAQP